MSADELFDLLGDEYTREVLESLRERPRTGREITEAVTASKATVYRRLNALEDAGLVATEHKLDPDGHHCEQFRVAAGRLALRLDDDGLSAEIDRSATVEDEAYAPKALVAGD